MPPPPTLPPTISQGILNFPGASPESKATLERLLEEDRQQNHCFYGRGLHNHLSHHLLAAYDLGAPAKLLQAIYDNEAKDLDPIHMADRATKLVEEQDVDIRLQNWTEFLGQHKYYANYVKFFTRVVADVGASAAIEEYVFAPAANGNEASMLLRFVGGALHPLIQTGYGVEFGSDAMVAQALAQTAVHSVTAPGIFNLPPEHTTNGKAHVGKGRQPTQGLSLLEILRQTYDSETMHPVMPYDNDALLSKRLTDALTDGRPEEIARLSALWHIDATRGQAELDDKVEEIIVLATILLAGSGKPGRKPRLDFFLMHLVTASLFLPSLLHALEKTESKMLLLKAMLPVILLYITLRGRPRIQPSLLMSHSSAPCPPVPARAVPHEGTIGALSDDACANPWPEIIASVLHAPDAHTVKTIRTLYYGAQKYGTTPRGGIVGAFRPDGTETHEGTAWLDGTIFVRAAGVVMERMDWVGHGQKAGQWDRSALGWDAAWEHEPEE